MLQQPRTYCLVIKRKNNDFFPVEWNLTKFYEGENLYTLDGIDKFTTKITRKELIELVNFFIENSNLYLDTCPDSEDILDQKETIRTDLYSLDEE